MKSTNSRAGGLAPAPNPTVAQLRAAAERGVRWILEQQQPDGSFCVLEDGVGSYYKVPRTLAVAGEWRSAYQLLGWVADNHITDAGVFRAPQRKAREPIHEEWPVYANAWLILGAQSIGRWDLAHRGMSYLTDLQLSTGGFYTLDGTTKFLEPVALSWGGMAALVTGYRGEALGAGDLLVQMVELQSDPMRFYYRMAANGNLITDVPAEKALDFYVDARNTKQIYYNPGIASIFLCNLYRATGLERYLDAGYQILHFTQRCAEDIHRFPPSGKLGLGCALLYGLTGEAQARQAAFNVGAYLLETQDSAGLWRLPDEAPYSALKNRESFDIQLDITAEFSVFLLEMAAIL